MISINLCSAKCPSGQTSKFLFVSGYQLAPSDAISLNGLTLQQCIDSCKKNQVALISYHRQGILCSLKYVLFFCTDLSSLLRFDQFSTPQSCCLAEMTLLKSLGRIILLFSLVAIGLRLLSYLELCDLVTFYCNGDLAIAIILVPTAIWLALSGGPKPNGKLCRPCVIGFTSLLFINAGLSGVASCFDGLAAVKNYQVSLETGNNSPPVNLPLIGRRFDLIKTIGLKGCSQVNVTTFRYENPIDFQLLHRRICGYDATIAAFWGFVALTSFFSLLVFVKRSAVTNKAAFRVRRNPILRGTIRYHT